LAGIGEDKMNFPKQRHINCQNTDCPICLEDHLAVGEYIENEINLHYDWLGRYRTFLDKKFKRSTETEFGWATEEFFDAKNADEFIKDWKEN
jgi:hypothetical protein